VLIKKYGTNGTHLAQMESARSKLALPRAIPEPGEPAFVPTPKAEPVAESAVEAPVAEVAADASAEPAAETPAEEPKAE